jgi:hypothetical protein
MPCSPSPPLGKDRTALGKGRTGAPSSVALAGGPIPSPNVPLTAGRPVGYTPHRPATGGTTAGLTPKALHEEM